uniref:Putative RecA n=1 Tax=viral metagenome TaxID=1070528 RepID=A0A6H1ZB82_9ZZZZ
MKKSVDDNLIVNKDAALDIALKQIEKQFGKGSIMRMNKDNRVDVEVISTGCLGLDAALGVGGLPRGRIIEFFGENMSSKSSLSLKVIAEAQKAGGMAAYIDVENAFSPVWATKLGVDVDKLIVSQADWGEQALSIAETLINSNSVDIIVIDSVAALVPKAELEGEMGSSGIALQARMMSQALRKLTGAINKSKCIVIFINQLRDSINFFFGNPSVTPGGRALKFYSSIRIEVRKVGNIKENDIIVGQTVKARVVKNKLAAPFRETKYDLLFDSGIDYIGNVVDLAIEAGMVEKGGAWYSYKEEKIGQGRANALITLKENKDMFKEIEKKVKKWLGLK